MNTETVLVVDDDPLVLSSLSALLRDQGMNVRTAATAADGLEQLRTAPVDIMVADVCLPDQEGLELLRQSRSAKPDVPVILVTGYGQIRDAVTSMRLGAFDYLSKPVRDDALRLSLARASETRALTRENARLRHPLTPPRRLDGLITRDYRLLRVCDTVMNVADSSAAVLIEGESGTGKTLIARLLHRHSARRDGPFVEVSCAAMPEGLLESELFGHVRGAFTSAFADREGKFKAADGGTILLDEIDNASPSLQMRLLRIAQDSTFERVGDNQKIKVDVRIVTATNRSLAAEVQAGRFREDLFHRLNVIRIEIPPLRERIRDIPLLCDHFVAELAREHGRPACPLSDEAMSRLVRHRWPGNIRELRNVVEHGSIMATGEQIELHDLPGWVARIEAPAEESGPRRTLRAAMQEPERRIILEALRQTGWNKRLAAQHLRVSRSTLYNKIKEYGLIAEA